MHEFGLPPRGRGNLPDGPPWPTVAGSTPAWAGQPNRVLCFLGLGSVYPRVGGATTRRRYGSDARYGLPPRGRGNPLTLCIF